MFYGNWLSKKAIDDWFHEKFLWFQFKTTYKQRAIESGKAFAKGVFPDEDIEMDFEDEDPVLRVNKIF